MDKMTNREASDGASIDVTVGASDNVTPVAQSALGRLWTRHSIQSLESIHFIIVSKSRYIGFP